MMFLISRIYGDEISEFFRFIKKLKFFSYQDLHKWSLNQFFEISSQIR
jgi:hypothetical protein